MSQISFMRSCKHFVAMAWLPFLNVALLIRSSLNLTPVLDVVVSGLNINVFFYRNIKLRMIPNACNGYGVSDACVRTCCSRDNERNEQHVAIRNLASENSKQS